MSKYPLMTLVAMGVVLLVAGVVLLFFSSRVVPHIRFILPLPPLAVASYVSASSLLSRRELRGVVEIHKLVRDVLVASAVAACAFLIFVSAMVLIVLWLVARTRGLIAR